MAMRKDKRKRHDLFCTIIQKLVETEGQEFDGKTWVLRSRKEWADLVGVALPTITSLSNIPPIEKLVKLVDNSKGLPVKAMALRIMRDGDKQTKSVRDLARVMQHLYNEKTGQKITREQFGMLNGLAKDWPEGYQIEIFKHVISTDGWCSYMAALSLHIDLLTEAEGEKGHTKRYYRFPSIPVLRKYWQVAADAYKSDMQQKGSDPAFPYYHNL